MTRTLRSALLLIVILTLAETTTFLRAAMTPERLAALPAGVAAPTLPADFADPSSGPITLYFTDHSLEPGDGPDSHLAAAIDAARVSVDVAAYEFELWSLRDALIGAHRRGLAVRLVAEADNADSPEMQALVAAGIPLVTDGPEGLMHDKFVIIDRQQVWMGSMNYTFTGAYRNDENLIAITSREAAAAYLAEFEEMFVGGRFGAFSPAGGPVSLSLEAAPLEIRFSPDDGVAARIIELINGARESIHFMAFSFTSDPIGDAMLAHSAAGMTVTGIFDESQYNSNGASSEFDRMLENGLAVRLDGNPDKLHAKVIIIDGEIVIAGSYNFSASAEEANDENVVIIFSEEIARAFLREWERIWEEAE